MAFDNTINPVASVKRKKHGKKARWQKKCLAKTMSPIIATKMRINSYMLGIMYDCYTHGVSIFGKKAPRTTLHKNFAIKHNEIEFIQKDSEKNTTCIKK